MTTAWAIPRLWEGRTVAIVGAGPSATPAALKAVRGLPTIAVNRAITLVPNADMMVSIDGNWPREADAFPGLRVVGTPGMPGLYVGVSYERVRLSPNEVIEIRHNTLLAMRIAAKAGARRIVLVGMDPERYEAIHSFRGFAAGLAALTQELRAAGVDVLTEDPEARPPLVAEGMHGLGDALHQRPVVQSLARRSDVWLRTAFPQIYRGLGVHCLAAGARSVRTAARNEARSAAYYDAGEPPPWSPVVQLGYTGLSVMQCCGVPPAMAVGVGLGELDPCPLVPVVAGLEQVARLRLPQDRPTLVYKPITGRREWGGLMARDPDPAAFRALLEPLRARFFTISVADLEPGSEWLAAEDAGADLELRGGELDIDGLVALYARAALVFSAPGFSVPLAQAVGTPAITVFGGFEDERSFAWGARHSPWLPILPLKPCPCWIQHHTCDKRIDLAAARERVEAFVAAL